MAITLSLDFELRWGVHDRVGLDRDAYRENLLGVREVVPRLLRLFVERDARATWATVGAVACASWDEYFRRAPPPPAYTEPGLAIDPRYAELDATGELHFAPDLVALVARTPGQDLGSHTFSHLYLGAPGVMRHDAIADHRALVSLFRERFGVSPCSLVFPRNQTAFIPVFREEGITMWRGNETPWWFNMAEHGSHPLIRGLRLVDALNPTVRRSDRVDDRMTRASLFVRFSLPEVAWRLHLARLRTELRRLRRGETLHLWFHPHNLGQRPDFCIGRLEQVLDAVDAHRPAWARWANMRDLAS